MVDYYTLMILISVDLSLNKGLLRHANCLFILINYVLDLDP